MPAFKTLAEVYAYKAQFEPPPIPAGETDPRLEMFLADLADVFVNYGLAVRGCGDCGSAWVEDYINGGILAEEIHYDPALHEIKYLPA